MVRGSGLPVTLRIAAHLIGGALHVGPPHRFVLRPARPCALPQGFGPRPLHVEPCLMQFLGTAAYIVLRHGRGGRARGARLPPDPVVTVAVGHEAHRYQSRARFGA